MDHSAVLTRQQFRDSLGGIGDRMTEAIGMMRTVFDEGPESEMRITHFRSIERDVDYLAGALGREIDGAWVTGFDRNGARALVACLARSIHCARKAVMQGRALQCNGHEKPIADACDRLNRAAEFIGRGVRNVGDAAITAEITEQLRSLKKENEEAFFTALEALFAKQSDLVGLLRTKDVLERLRATLDAHLESAHQLKRIAFAYA